MLDLKETNLMKKFQLRLHRNLKRRKKTRQTPTSPKKWIAPSRKIESKKVNLKNQTAAKVANKTKTMKPINSLRSKMSATVTNSWLSSRGKVPLRNQEIIPQKNQRCQIKHIRSNMYTVTEVRKLDKIAFIIQRIGQFI